MEGSKQNQEGSAKRQQEGMATNKKKEVPRTYAQLRIQVDLALKLIAGLMEVLIEVMEELSKQGAFPTEKVNLAFRKMEEGYRRFQETFPNSPLSELKVD